MVQHVAGYGRRTIDAGDTMGGSADPVLGATSVGTTTARAVGRTPVPPLAHDVVHRDSPPTPTVVGTAHDNGMARTLGLDGPPRVER